MEGYRFQVNFVFHTVKFCHKHGNRIKGISRVNQNGEVYKQIMQELQMTGL